MIDHAALNKLVRDSINTILGIPGFAVAAKQNAPRPAGAYAVVDFLTSVNYGWENITYENDTLTDDLIENIEGLKLVTLSISFFRDSARNNAEKVRIGLLRQSVQSAFYALDVGLISRSEIRDIDESLEFGWEDRAQMDITISVSNTDSDTTPAIAAMTITGEVQVREKEVIDATVEVTNG